LTLQSGPDSRGRSKRFTSLLKAGVVTPGQRDQAMQQLTSYARSFSDALAVINRHGRFTPQGRTIFSDAVAYMTESARDVSV
jgi:hypothetical protein